jgi:hypothetical protein
MLLKFQVPVPGFRIPASNPSTRCACSGLASNIKLQTSNFKPSLVYHSSPCDKIIVKEDTWRFLHDPGRRHRRHKNTLGLFREESGPGHPLAEEVFSSQDHGSLEEITAIFLEKERPGHIESACFALAGPILSGRASVTNLPWTVRDDALSAAAGVNRVKLINDVQAVACSVPILEEKDLCTLSAGKPVTNGTVAVIAVGTGLGEAFLTWDGESYLSHPSEGRSHRLRSR